MVAPGKGIIAIDESTATCAKRFDGVGIENTEENRRAYRELLLTAPKLGEYISGAILFDETMRQSTKAGVPFAKYMMPTTASCRASRSTRARRRWRVPGRSGHRRPGRPARAPEGVLQAGRASSPSGAR
jgi:hypothetical protein